jgi:3-methyladenine DNA glycosylase AlkD
MAVDRVQFLRERFGALANPANAKPMAAYMKTGMPFYGIKKPDRVPVLRELDLLFPIESRADYASAIRSLWSQPHREEKYAAIHIAVKHEQFIVPEMLPLYRRLIIEGAWWDFVDEIAIRLVGRLVLNHRKRLNLKVDQWINDGNMWIRRSAILCQNKHREQTDHQRLFAYCLGRADEKEFFIRKAIGWALREYAYAEPNRVRSFLKRYKSRLSGLSFREAAKHLDLP